MAVQQGNDQWNRLNDTVYNWIYRHAQPTIDIDLANWLDPSGSIFRDYQRYKTGPGSTFSIEVQVRHLMSLWKSFVGENDATPEQLHELISKKRYVQELVDNLQPFFEFKRQDNKFYSEADRIYALWSVVLAVRSTCKHQLGAMFSVQDLKDNLERLRKIRNGSNENRITPFHPLNFDKMIITDIQDSENKRHTFEIKVKDMTLDSNTFDDELYELEENNHVIYEMYEKCRCMLVIHTCGKTRKEGCENERHGFFMCLDKESLDENNLPDHPKIQIESRHYTLYKISIIPILP